MQIIKKLFKFIIFPILILEILLRVIGVRPSVFRDYNGFTSEENLILYKNYENDNEGIYKFSSLVVDSLQKDKLMDKSWFKKPKYLYDFLTKKNTLNITTDALYQVLSDFSNIENSDFANYSQKIFQKTSFDVNDSLIIEYSKQPFNEEGFRSISFRKTNSKRVKVLLLGDSFTFGLSANPIHNSFADYLLSKGYLVYNTGIAGVDPAQYYAITKKYLSILKPDIVILNFCTNNDLMLFDRNLNKHEPHEHLTNAGFFYSNPEGKYLDYKEAYRYYLKFITIPQQNNIFKEFFFNKTAIGTKIWALLFNQSLVNIHEYDKYLEAQDVAQSNKIEITKKYLSKTQQICEENNIPILFCLIPDVSKYFINEEGNLLLKDNDILTLFKEIDYQYPNNFTIDDFVGNGNNHFNNNGSKKYGVFLEKQILYSLN
jgi:hypothetical protein